MNILCTFHTSVSWVWYTYTHTQISSHSSKGERESKENAILKIYMYSRIQTHIHIHPYKRILKKNLQFSRTIIFNRTDTNPIIKKNHNPLETIFIIKAKKTVLT